MLPATLQFLIVMIASAINDRLQRKLDYVEEERRVLREQLDAATAGKKLSFTANQRRRLGEAGKLLTPDERQKCCLLVKPATILAWFRQLAARKYDSSEARRGRPPKPKDVRKLVIKLAMENRGWGYTKIRDALRTGLGIEIGRTTVADILAAAGVEPAPEREKTRTWKECMKAHWDSLCACDFFSVEVLGLGGTVRYLVFFVIVLKTRAVEIAGIGVNPGGEWMKQMARNLTDGVDGFLREAKYLIHDRDPLFTEAFETVLRERGVECVKIPAQSPNCNPHAERFVKTIKYECLNHLVFFGERHLRYVVKEFMAHYSWVSYCTSSLCA
jgi:putative transposase